MRLIDAEILFDKVGKIKPRNEEHYKSIGEFMNMITNSPTIHFVINGNWKYNNGVFNAWTCDQCNANNDEMTNFCPNCGADMRGDTDV